MSDSSHESRAVSRHVSAGEREEAVKRLTSAFADDAITVDEFERRVAEVYAAQSPQALKAITDDLPAQAPGVPVPRGSGVPAPVDASTGIARRPVEKIDSLLSSVERAVPGLMPERLDVRSVLASLELDLRRAEFPAGVTEIHIEAILGSVEVELPDHVRLEHEGMAFLGSFSVRGRSRGSGVEAGPVVRITGRSILSSVEIELDG